MRKTTLIEDAVTKLAAQYLIQNGLATYAEISALSGRSRQVVKLWSAKLGAETARRDHLTKLWTKTLREVSK